MANTRNTEKELVGGFYHNTFKDSVMRLGYRKRKNLSQTVQWALVDLLLREGEPIHPEGLRNYKGQLPPELLAKVKALPKYKKKRRKKSEMPQPEPQPQSLDT